MPPDPKNPLSRRHQETHAKKKFTREETLRRLGVPSPEWQKAHRFCSNHKLEKISECIPIKVIDREGKLVKTEWRTRDFNVPVAWGGDAAFWSPPKKPSRGTARDRRAFREINDISNQIKDGGQGAETAKLALALYQTTEMTDIDQCDGAALGDINASLLAASSLDVHESSDKTTPSKLGNVDRPKAVVRGEEKIPKVVPSVRIGTNLPAKEVKRRTGFEDIASLLAFVTVVCDGDFEVMKKCVSIDLTWLEEWFLYFERIWGRSAMRFVDLARHFDISTDHARNVFRPKLRLVIEARDRWPPYASYDEDRNLRDEKWTDRYGDRRIVFWDNTNVDMPKASNSELQRITFSSYYGGNVAKGGVMLQPCGWIGVWDLWTGAVSDTDFLKKTRILDLQDAFVERDLINGEKVPFTNILDRGYTELCWRHGARVSNLCCNPLLLKATPNSQERRLCRLLLSQRIELEMKGPYASAKSPEW
jgi:hypothetical protein